MPYLEICVDSVASALAAEAGGADAVELCSALAEGGVTPSLGLLRAVRSRLRIGVQVLIRPRTGDFVYSSDEFAVMQEDIRLAAAEGANGVVLGLLTKEHAVDLERTRQLVRLAMPMQVTFHRAIDLCSDPVAVLEAIVQSGAACVLTSGGEVTALQGQATIAKLVEAAGKRIRIMAGGGIRAGNLLEILLRTGATHWHTAARRARNTQADRGSPANGLAEQFGTAQDTQPVLEADVRLLRTLLDAAAASRPEPAT